MARGTAVKIVLSAEERGELETLVRRRKSSHGAATRARIVLLAAEGLNNSTTAKKLHISRLTVGTWRRRFAKKRRDGLDDEPRPGAPRKIGDDKITEVVTKTLETMPQDATPLEPPVDGQVLRCFGNERTSHLGCLRAATAPGRDLQALHRPNVCRESARHRRAVPRSAGSCAGALCGREEPNPGT